MFFPSSCFFAVTDQLVLSDPFLLFPSLRGSQAPVPDIKHLFSLNFAADVARDFLIPVPEEWVDCAKKVKVPFDVEKKYHPEYDGYSPGKQRGSSRPSSWPLLALCKPARSGETDWFKHRNSG